MQIQFDEAKNARNITERDLPFTRVAEFDFDTALMWQDTRRQYPEIRYNGLGYLGDRLHFVCFTPITDGIRVISFRKANEKERSRYEQA